MSAYLDLSPTSKWVAVGFSTRISLALTLIAPKNQAPSHCIEHSLRVGSIPWDGRGELGGSEGETRLLLRQASVWDTCPWEWARTEP